MNQRVPMTHRRRVIDMKSLTRVSTIFFLILALLGSAAQSFAPEPVPRPAQRQAIAAGEQHGLSSADRINVFEQVWETINQRYYDPSFKGVDWRNVHDSYRPLVDKVGTDEEFYEVLKRMVGE